MARVPLGPARKITRNWAGNVEFSASDVIHPRGEREIVHAIALATARGGALKPIGAGHSFSTIAQPKDVSLTLDQYRGIVDLDPETGDVTLRAGTRLFEVGPLLAKHSRALPTMGDIDHQSIAGAISTGTHGTGARYTGFSGIVTGLKIVLANGDTVWADRERNPILFEAARLSLGALGVIVEVRLKTVPLYKLRKKEYTKPLDAAIAEFLDTNLEHDHQEFFWSPSSNKVSMRDLDHVPVETPTSGPGKISRFIDAELVGNGAFMLTNTLARTIPSTHKVIANTIMTLMPSKDAVDLPYTVFAESRRIRFKETEIAVPAEVAAEALETLVKRVNDSGTHIVFPLEIRRGAPDDVWMSSTYERDAVYVAAHQSIAEKNEDLIRLVHDTMVEFGGRPHWGKMHWLGANELRELHPRFDDFVAVRNEVDPQRIFANSYLDHTIGE